MLVQILFSSATCEDGAAPPKRPEIEILAVLLKILHHLILSCVRRWASVAAVGIEASGGNIIIRLRLGGILSTQS